MSANFLCWVPAIALLPSSPGFMDRVDEFDRQPAKPPAPAIVRFVNDLLKRYPDLTETRTDTPWADGPMIRDANGGFINFSIRWDYYDKITPFVTSAARRDGLNCFDPQTAEYYPASGTPYIIAKYAVRQPVADERAAIETARRVCGLEPSGSGQWHAALAGSYWHVWFGPGETEPPCASESADIARDGGHSVCGVHLCKNK
jgi:hypothetical protein